MSVVLELCDEIERYLEQSRTKALAPKEIALLSSAMVLLRHFQERDDAALRSDQRNRFRPGEGPRPDRGSGEERQQSVLSEPVRDPRRRMASVSDAPF